MAAHQLTILCLYPNEMSFYGDMGNVLAVQRRLEWRGIGVEVIHHHPGQKLNERADLILGGGGQDSGQLKIYKDLLRIGPRLHALAERGTPMLMICGLYQLFGKEFITSGGERLDGIGLFNLTTTGQGSRLVGNIAVETKFGTIVGYENHSGRTLLLDGQAPFGRVLKGYGNNGEGERTEGAITQNVYGTYLHGAVLPRNPALADTLIAQALQNRYGDKAPQLKPLDDAMARRAAAFVQKRPQ